MLTFEFDNTASATSVVNVTGVSALPYTEQGVNFVFSIFGGDGSNLAAIGFEQILGGGSGVFGGFNFTGANATSNDVFVLDVTGPSQTQFSGTIVLEVVGVAGSWTVAGTPLPGTGTVSLTGPLPSLVFTNISGDSGDLFIIESLSATINCFAAGTKIATPAGPRNVETLQADDLVLTPDGRETVVKWLGVQPVDSRLMHPAKVNPVRITAGALGDGLPERDLRVSPDHAIEIDGSLINAGALVNGSTIYQEQGKLPDGFTYYHIETEAHELLLAEGVAAESFIDYAGRDTFENGGESKAQITEMDLPRISSSRLVPDHIRARLTPALAAE